MCENILMCENIHQTCENILLTCHENRFKDSYAISDLFAAQTVNVFTQGQICDGNDDYNFTKHAN